MWCDWRFNIGVQIKCWDVSQQGQPYQEQEIPVAFVDYINKEIFLGTPYGEDFFDNGDTVFKECYEDIESLTNTITHETIHLILAKKIDLFGDWDGYEATKGFDKICKEINL